MDRGGVCSPRRPPDVSPTTSCRARPPHHMRPYLHLRLATCSNGAVWTNLDAPLLPCTSFGGAPDESGLTRTLGGAVNAWCEQTCSDRPRVPTDGDGAGGGEKARHERRGWRARAARERAAASRRGGQRGGLFTTTTSRRFPDHLVSRSTSSPYATISSSSARHVLKRRGLDEPGRALVAVHELRWCARRIRSHTHPRWRRERVV